MKNLFLGIFAGILLSFPSFETRAQSSLDFSGASQFSTLPAGMVQSLNGDYTIEAWFYLRSAAAWSRVFDFGSNTTVNMFLTPANGATATPRFAITVGGGGAAEQVITAPAPLTLNTWYHIAVVVQHASNTGTMYINGNSVASNNAMTLRPSDLGATTNNWLGRSQYPDPYFDGFIDQLRISTSARYTSNFTPQQTPFITDANTLAVYVMDEGTGQVITDGTGNFNGVLGASMVLEPTDPTWSTGSVLPVSLTYFRAHLYQKNVSLQWQTSRELNNRGFYIERSPNSIDFETIGFIPGKTNSQVNTDYRFRDSQPFTATSFYRLRQVDLDGKTSYSKLIQVRAGYQTMLQVLNNGGKTVEIRLDNGASEIFSVYDLAGRSVKKGNLVQGRTVVHHLPAGLYQVSVLTESGEMISTKVIIK